MSNFFATKEERSNKGYKSAFLDLSNVLRDLDEECNKEEEEGKKVLTKIQTKLTIQKTTSVVIKQEVVQIDLPSNKNEKRSSSV